MSFNVFFKSKLQSLAVKNFQFNKILKGKQKELQQKLKNKKYKAMKRGRLARS